MSTSVKKTTTKKAAEPKKTAAEKKTTPKEPAVKKTAVKKATVEKAPVKKETTKKTVVKKAVAKKTAPIKKAGVKKSSSKEHDEKIDQHPQYIPDEVDIVRELPNRYNETRLTLMMRDPEWCFFYWDISDNDVSYHSLEGRRISVRIFHVFGYDITNGEIHRELDVNAIYGDRYINLAMPHAYFIGELGYYDAKGNFIVLARSNMIYAPRDSISNIYDEEWMVNEEIIKLLKSPKALRESLSSATIFELIDLKRHHLAGSSSSLFSRKG